MFTVEPRRLSQILVLALLSSGSAIASVSAAPFSVFGLHFGEPFDPSHAIGKNMLINGEVLYQVKAPQPYPPFRQYFVAITPNGHHIYSILAMGQVDSDKTCAIDQEHLLQPLAETEGGKLQTSSNLFRRRATVAGKVLRASIECLWTTNPGITLRAAYEDPGLAASANPSSTQGSR